MGLPAMSTEAKPVSLSLEEIDDVIYSARAGDLDALKSDITNLSQQYGCTESDIIHGATDIEEESEGGTGSCLLHWPAANGNIEILRYILNIISPSSSTTSASSLLNHKNHSGNTPLHWAALNAKFDCVKALVEAGADVSVKNNAGHDAAFLAERADWSSHGETEASGQENQTEEAGGSDAQPGESRPVTVAMQVVEYLLGCDQGEGEGAASGAGSGEQHEGDGDTDGTAAPSA